MPLTDEQKAALSTIAAADPKEVADALKANAQDAYQAVFRVGYGTAKGEYETKLSAKDAEIATIAEARDAAAAALDAERGKAPDAEAIRTQYEERLARQKEEAEAAVRAAQERLTAKERERQEEALAADFIAQRVDPDYARHILVAKHSERVKVGEDGAVKYLDRDGMTPLPNREAFVRDAVRDIDPKWIVSTAGSGGGATGGNGGHQNGYDPVAAGKAAAERQRASQPDTSLAFR